MKLIAHVLAVAALASVLAGAALPAADDGRGGAGYVMQPPRPGRGEVCIVCRRPIVGEDVVEVQHLGRTFFVGAPLLPEFRSDPQRYFARVQARSALFDEASLEAPAMSTGWLWFGVYVLAGVVCAAVCAYLAVTRALRPLPWFFAGLAGNVAGVAAVLMAPRGDASSLPAGIPPGLRKVPVTRMPAACPACGSPNHPAARACAACGAALAPAAATEVR